MKDEVLEDVELNYTGLEARASSNEDALSELKTEYWRVQGLGTVFNIPQEKIVIPLAICVICQSQDVELLVGYQTCNTCGNNFHVFRFK